MSSEEMLFEAQQAQNEALDMEYREQEYKPKKGFMDAYRENGLSPQSESALASIGRSRALTDNPLR